MFGERAGGVWTDTLRLVRVLGGGLACEIRNMSIEERERIREQYSPAIIDI